MDSVAAKLISLSCLIVLTLTFSVIPYFLVLRGSRSLVSDRKRDKVIALLNCFGGGVFLGTLLLHLMTEGSEEFDVYKSKAGWKTDFPIFNIFVAGGFFMVAFIEFFMHSHLHHKKSTHVNVHPSEEGLLQEQDSVFESQYGAVGDHRRELLSGSGCSTLLQKNNKSFVDHHETDGLLQEKHNHHIYKPVIENTEYITVGDAVPGSSIRDRIVQQKHEHQNCEIVSQEIDNSVISSEPVSGIPEVIGDFPDGLRAFLLLIALSFHTIFDGLAVGLQDSVSEVWQVFTAISIHKSIIAFCLGLEMFKSQPTTPWRAFAWICFFSLMSPIGIALGIGLTSSHISELARLLSSSILQGVAAGTFLYVTFLEILNMYIGHNCHRSFLNIFCALIGYAFMAVVKLFDKD